MKRFLIGVTTVLAYAAILLVGAMLILSSGCGDPPPPEPQPDAGSLPDVRRYSLTWECLDGCDLDRFPFDEADTLELQPGFFSMFIAGEFRFGGQAQARDDGCLTLRWAGQPVESSGLCEARGAAQGDVTWRDTIVQRTATYQFAGELP